MEWGGGEGAAGGGRCLTTLLSAANLGGVVSNESQQRLYPMGEITLTSHVLPVVCRVALPLPLLYGYQYGYGYGYLKTCRARAT